MKSQRKNLSKLMAGTLAATLFVGLTPANVFAEEETYRFVTMNVPYDVFYGSYMTLQNSTEGTELNIAVDVDTNGDSKYDAISTATTSKFKMTTGLANGTWNNGTVITGVTIPVRVSASEYELLEANKAGLESTSAYYYTDITVDEEHAAPTAYSELDVVNAGGSLSYDFSAMNVSTYAESASQYLGIKNLTYRSSYGDVQFDIDGFHTGKTAGVKGVQVGENTYVDATIYGAVIETEAGKQFAMTCLENLWFAAKAENPEIAFSVPDGQQNRKQHGSGNLFCQLGDGLDGAKITNLKLITSVGVFNAVTSTQLANYYKTPGLGIEINEDQLTITNYPAELRTQETFVTVTGLSEDNEVVFDESGVGTAELDDVAVDGTAYSVVITSEGAGPVIKSVSTRMSNAQFETLSYWYGRGLKALKQNEGGDAEKLAALSTSMASAKTLLENADTSYSAAAKNMTDELIAKVKVFYTSPFTAGATLTGNKLVVSLEGIALKDLIHPTYKVTYTESMRGRLVTKELTAGSLTSLNQTLSVVPTAGGTYKVVVVSDNYKDVESEEITAIGTPTVTLTAKKATYNGSVISIADAVTNSDGEVTIKYYADSACMKLTSTANGATATGKAPKNAGTYYVKATTAATAINKAAESKVVTLTIAKAKPVLSAGNVSKQLSASALQKKAQTIKLTASVTGKGKITFAKSSGSSAFTVNKTTGAITVKKGTKKGTYKLTVKVSAAASTNYLAATKTITITVKVK